MTYINPSDSETMYTEFKDTMANYTDGEVTIFDHAKDFAAVYAMKAKSNLITVCTAGNLTMKINKTSVEVKANDVLFCPSQMTISDVVSSADFECKVLALSDHIIQRLLHDKMTIWNNAVYVNETNIITMSETCRAEIELYYALLRSKIKNQQNTPSPEIIQALVKALLLELCLILESMAGRNVESGKMSQGKMLFNRFLGMVSNNSVKRRPISHYASQLAITPKYLTMLCLKYSDKTASDWIIQYTTEDIRFYLKNSNLSIKEISAKLGFANMSHFGSYVRKHLGLSPSDFRHRRNND